MLGLGLGLGSRLRLGLELELAVVVEHVEVKRPVCAPCECTPSTRPGHHSSSSSTP